jgi:hypothetical protein
MAMLLPLQHAPGAAAARTAVRQAFSFFLFFDWCETGKPVTTKANGKGLRAIHETVTRDAVCSHATPYEHFISSEGKPIQGGIRLTPGQVACLA